MQRRHIKLLMLAAFISLLVVLPGQINANLGDQAPGTYIASDDSERLEIEVEVATYTDYDADGQEDNVLIVFEIEHPDEDWDGGWLEIRCAVAKPSGASMGISFSVETENGVEITMVWFNYADESGWYTFYCKAAVMDGSAGAGYIEHVFDPPGGGKDIPGIGIMSIDQL